MSPDGVTLNLIIRELQEILIPARVERVYLSLSVDPEFAHFLKPKKA